METPLAQATATPEPAPVATRERQGPLDLLRGFALLGILLVNIEYFAAPVYEGYGARAFAGPVEGLASWLILALAESKFYLLFSFLFGYGLAVQIARAAGRRTPLIPRYLRRLGGLLAIGLAHAFFLFVGDILVTYAVLGLLLLPFRRVRSRTLLLGAGVALLLALALDAALIALLPGGAGGDDRAAQAAARQAYAEGTFAAVVAQRARDLGFVYAILPFLQWPSAFAMFLLGLYAGRRGIFVRLNDHLPLFRALFAWGLPIGLAGSLVYATVTAIAGRATFSPWQAAGLLVQTATAPALCCVYVAGMVLLTQRAAWRRRLAPLEAAGRMSLSNYLLQSLICATLFNGYGFGLYGRTGPAAGLALAVGIYLIQVPLSVWWLRRFQSGPAEWLLRSLTYLKPQPLRAARDPVGEG